MEKAHVSKNGTINLPAEIKKKLHLKPGDEVVFLETSEGIVIAPVYDIFSLFVPSEINSAKEFIDELHEERKSER